MQRIQTYKDNKYNTNVYDRIAMNIATSQTGITDLCLNPIPKGRNDPSKSYEIPGLT